jgi:hypothetical protein
MMGPAVAVPVPEEVTDSLKSVQVTSTSGRTTGFQLTFTLSNRSPLQTLFLLTGGTSLIPLLRVILVVTTNGTPDVLIDGVITNHQVTPSNTPGQSTLAVTGEDLTRVMDYIDFSGVPYPGMPPEARVAVILAKYAMFGILPLIVPSVLTDVPIPTEMIPRHEGTDLKYIKQLADDAGYVFYIEPGPVPGTNTAYWGPEIKVGVPQPALNVNMDAFTNVESLNFNFAADSRVTPLVYVQVPFTELSIPVPIPDVSLLNPPLGAIPPIPTKFEPLDDTAKFSPIRAALLGLAKESGSIDSVSASGTLDVLRYGHILKARQLVGVRGSGAPFDGLYYVNSVTHNIKVGEYKQNFTLSRNGLLSTVPVVPT